MGSIDLWTNIRSNHYKFDVKIENYMIYIIYMSYCQFIIHSLENNVLVLINYIINSQW